MDGTARPAMACLDTREIREAAAGEPEDPAVSLHLTKCKRCRREVRELRAALGGSTWSGGSTYRRSVLARPGFWLFLITLPLVVYAVVMFMRQKPRQEEPPSALEQQEQEPEPEQPVAAESKRPRARRARAPRSSGSSADAEIVAVIRNNQTGVRMCYERALKSDPGLSLRLDARVNISAAGLVDQVSLSGLRAGSPLHTCIHDVMRGWKFPPRAAPYDTAFPMILQKSP
jgi:hypothetical protein